MKSNLQIRMDICTYEIVNRITIYCELGGHSEQNGYVLSVLY